MKERGHGLGRFGQLVERVFLARIRLTCSRRDVTYNLYCKSNFTICELFIALARYCTTPELH